MDITDVLGCLRPLVIEVDGFGVVRGAHGGFGGFLGLDLANLVGQSVFDHVAPTDAEELTANFAESAGETLETVSLPLPFRVEMIGGDGGLHPVDVIATGRDAGGEHWSWVAILVPAVLQSTISRPVDALIAREPRERVKALLTEELAVDNERYSSRGFLVEPVAPASVEVVTSRPEDQDVSDEIARSVARGWSPWTGIGNAETMAIAVDSLPAGLRSLVQHRGWRRISATPVALGGEVVAVYLVMGRVPDGYVVDQVLTNVASRFRYIARVTALIVSGWRDRDQLEYAATHDALTGLANRRAFDAAVAATDGGGVLFIDVDGFKSVNDGCGHSIGDRVLVEVARRIEAACGHGDLAARIGGDEFAVLVRSDTDLAVLAAAIATAVGAPLAIDAGPRRVAVSIGAVRDIVDGDWLAPASRAMRRHKRNPGCAGDAGRVAVL